MFSVEKAHYRGFFENFPCERTTYTIYITKWGRIVHKCATWDGTHDLSASGLKLALYQIIHSAFKTLYIVLMKVMCKLLKQ